MFPFWLRATYWSNFHKQKSLFNNWQTLEPSHILIILNVTHFSLNNIIFSLLHFRCKNIRNLIMCEKVIKSQKVCIPCIKVMTIDLFLSQNKTKNPILLFPSCMYVVTCSNLSFVRNLVVCCTTLIRTRTLQHNYINVFHAFHFPLLSLRLAFGSS